MPLNLSFDGIDFPVRLMISNKAKPNFKYIPGIGIPAGRDAGRAGAGEKGERGGAVGAGEEGGGAERGDETGDGQNQGDLQGKQN